MEEEEGRRVSQAQRHTPWAPAAQKQCPVSRATCDLLLMTTVTLIVVNGGFGVAFNSKKTTIK
jgi:hypothetical protein